MGCPGNGGRFNLLAAELGCHVESFRTGKDQGIDLRYATISNAGATTIVQCKHYAKSGLSALRSALKRTELPKLQKLQPAHYRLVTSVPLSPANKDELVELLTPFLRGPADVIGQEDLNAMLSRHPEVEKRHFKLWIASTTVLSAILNNDIFSRSYVAEAEIQRRLSLFVPTPAVRRAQQLLEAHGSCIISGIPGIGKTTTAEILVALSLQHDWEVVQLIEGARDAFRVHDPSKKQLFLFDDFLGRTSFGDNPLRRGESQDLVSLMRLCQRMPQSKRIILTTREYILAQARQSDEVLFHAEIERCVVALSDYSDNIRAKILVNHLYFYDVPEDFRTTLVRSGAARKVLSHENYSPRIVEWMCEAPLRFAKTPDEFANIFMRTLADPSKLWSHAFDNQLSPGARDIVWTLASIGDSCVPDDLLNAAISYRSGQSSGQEMRELRQALAELEGNFIEIHADTNYHTVSYHNPSVKDFTDRLLRSDVGVAAALFARARYFEQVSRLLTCAERPDSLASEELILQKVQETLEVPSPLVVGKPGRKPNLSVLRRLAELSEQTVDCSLAFKRSVATLVLSYFSRPSEVFALAGDWVRAYQYLCRYLPGHAGVPSLDQFLKLVLSEISSYLEFPDVLPLLEDHPMLEEYSDSLVQFAETELQDLILDPGSSEDLQNSLNELEEVLVMFSVDSEVDLREVHDLIEEQREREEEYADHHQDEWKEQMYEARDEERSIDETLNSLLD